MWEIPEIDRGDLTKQPEKDWTMLATSFSVTRLSKTTDWKSNEAE
jgi:hypothetical protein